MIEFFMNMWKIAGERIRDETKFVHIECRVSVSNFIIVPNGLSYIMANQNESP